MKARVRASSLFGFLAIGAWALTLVSQGHAAAESVECDRLRSAISEASQSGQSAQFQAAAQRQRSEIDRTTAFAQEIGCDNKKFLFFGSDPPAQCAQIRAQIGRMRANLDSLQARAGGGTRGRGELIARYNAQCGSPGKQAGLVEAIFGQPRPGEVEEQPLFPEQQDGSKGSQEKLSAPIGEARAGGKAVCVRSCDGAFFPVSYSAGTGRLEQLADICRALCPSAEVTLYTFPVNGEIEQAVSINGARYMDSPTALRYRKTFDSSCACRRRGQTWANALGPAESLLGQEDKADIIVTPEKAAELSRPKVDSKVDLTKSKTGKALKTPAVPVTSPGAVVVDEGKTDGNGVDNALRDAAASLSRENSGIAAAADGAKSVPVAEGHGKVFDEVGPDGGKRKVRVVGY